MRWLKRGTIGRSTVPDDGRVTLDPGMTIGCFSQDVGETLGKSAVAAVMDGVGPVSELIVERARLAAPLPASV